VAGGVAANRAIGAALAELAKAQGFSLRIPPGRLCTDNAAMIAWAGLERFAAGAVDPISIGPRARWPLEALRRSDGNQAKQAGQGQNRDGQGFNNEIVDLASLGLGNTGERHK
jgi:hypothetical protein